jgi:hypothetical protein
VVPHEDSVSLCAKLRETGGACDLVLVEDAPHGMTNWEKNPAQQAYKKKLIEWLRVRLAVR